MSTGILNLTNDLRDYLWEKGMKEHPALEELRRERDCSTSRSL